MSNPHTYVGWVSNHSEISVYILIAQYRMKISIIANFYFGVMLPLAKVGICMDIIWLIEQRGQTKYMTNPPRYLFGVRISAISQYIEKNVKEILCYMELSIA